MKLRNCCLQDWEAQNGKIPASAVILMNSGWGSRYPNKKRVFNTEDERNTSSFHFPGKERISLILFSGSSYPCVWFFGFAPSSGCFGRTPSSGCFGCAPSSGCFGRAPNSGCFVRAPSSGCFGCAPSSGALDVSPVVGALDVPQ